LRAEVTVALRESEVTVINLIQSVRRAFPGREVRAMYGAVFPNAAETDWSDMNESVRVYLEDDRRTRLWFLLAKLKLEQYTVGVVLYRQGRDERGNTPTIPRRPHLLPADYPDFDSDEP
jgi:hypothetical protein